MYRSFLLAHHRAKTALILIPSPGFLSVLSAVSGASSTFGDSWSTNSASWLGGMSSVSVIGSIGVSWLAVSVVFSTGNILDCSSGNGGLPVGSILGIILS